MEEIEIDVTYAVIAGLVKAGRSADDLMSILGTKRVMLGVDIFPYADRSGWVLHKLRTYTPESNIVGAE